MSKGCFMVAAGRNATADGSVLVARSCDAGGNYALRVVAVPRKRHSLDEVLAFKRIPDMDTPIPPGVQLEQVAVTFRHVAIMGVVKGEEMSTALGGINEYQVCAGASSGGFLNHKAEEVSPLMPTSLGDYRCTLVLERCRTAREGVMLLGELTERFGARTDNYIVADPTEAWLYEEYKGHLWVAIRVPDDFFVVEANTFRIDSADLDNTENCICCPNLISFAIENKLYDPKNDGPFSPMKVYGAQTGKTRYNMLAPNYDRRRIWRGMSLLAPSTKLDPGEPSWVYPLFLKPDKKITPKDLFTVLMDHYQGTEYDHYGMNSSKYRPVGSLEPRDPGKVKEIYLHLNAKRLYQPAPVWGQERIIGTTRAVTTYCAQLRNWLPDPMGGVLWAGLAEGATSAHIPWYCGITETPQDYNVADQEEGPYLTSLFKGSLYDESSAYWAFRILSNLVNLFYTATRDEVIPVWREWEDNLYALQPAIEKTALELCEKPYLLIDFLTTYSCSKAEEALEMAKIMARKLHTIIARYNAPL